MLKDSIVYHILYYTNLTLFAVVFIFVQDKATPALAAVATEGVHTLMLAATVLLRALILICEESEQSPSDDTHTFTQFNFYSLFAHKTSLGRKKKKT